MVSQYRDMAEVDDERTEELGTLQSIYPELVLDPSNPHIAVLDLLVAPSKPLPVTFKPGHEVIRLEYLPSLRLNISLPVGYPACAPPTVTPTTSPSWLPEDILERIVEESNSIWEEYGGATILFSYISSLQEQADNAFGLEELTLPESLRKALMEYNTQMKKEIFDKETFDCGVCLEPKKGLVCYRMQRCSHVFCIACLQDYYNSCIAEGHVHNVKCMSTDCGKAGPNDTKKDRLLSPKELLAIPLSYDQVSRYARIKRKKKIESDPSMIFCPRSWCQGPMRTEKYPKITNIAELDASDSEGEGEIPTPQEHTAIASGQEKPAARIKGTDRLAVCEDCNLAFCVVCLASWHGDFVRCEPRDTTQLSEEDQASLDFILKNTSPCPYCSVPCQKSMGCNHMTCAQCKTHFCYLCSAWLNPDHPYAHFNDAKSKFCFQRLFDGVEGDMENGNVQFGGRRGAEAMADFWEQEALRMQMEADEEDVGVVG